MLTIPWATSTTIPEGSTLRQVSRLDSPGSGVPGFSLRRSVSVAS